MGDAGDTLGQGSQVLVGTVVGVGDEEVTAVRVLVHLLKGCSLLSPPLETHIEILDDGSLSLDDAVDEHLLLETRVAVPLGRGQEEDHSREDVLVVFLLRRLRLAVVLLSHLGTRSS